MSQSVKNPSVLMKLKKDIDMRYVTRESKVIVLNEVS